MTLVATTTAAAGRGSIAGLASALSSRWLGAGLLLAAVLSQSFGHFNGDNSWWLTVAEKVLDGARPYVDVIESNPPGAIFLYAPAVAFARLAHVPPEFAAAAFIFLCCGASMGLAGLVLRRAGLLAAREAGFVRNAAIFSLILLPGFSFGQREHAAGLLILPILAVYAARASGARVGADMTIIAGLAAALAASIKPHFALAVALPFLFVLARRRSLTPIFALEQIIATAGALAVAALTLIWFPSYRDLASVMFDAYVPLREPWSYLLTETWFIANLILLGGLAIAFGRACLAPRVAVPALASIGFIGAYLIQGKGWVNHGLPGVELAFLAAAMATAPILAMDGDARDIAWARVRQAMLFVFFPVALGAPILFGLLLPLSGFEEYKGLTAAVLRHAPPHPRIIALSPRLDVGHPLTRRVGGTWVGRPNAIWLMVFSRMFIDAGRGDEAYRARLAAYIDRDAKGFAEDVRAGQPDIVLVVDDRRIEKAMAHPAIAAAMRAYAPVESADGIAVWTRRAPPESKP